MSNRAAPRSLDENAVIRRLSLVSLIGNSLLSAFKLLAGVWGHSGAMISDAIHSFSDVPTTFIAWFGVKVSAVPPKPPTLTATNGWNVWRPSSWALCLWASIGVGRAGLETVLSGQYDNITPPGAIALAAAVLSIISKGAMYWYTRYYAKLIHSDAFLAGAWHHRSDAFSSVGPLIGIGGAMLGFPVMDSVASVVICLFILKVAYDILKDAVVKMLDTSCREQYEAELQRFVSAQQDVVCVDTLHSRMFGSKVYVDLEIEVDGSKTLQEAHAVAGRVHNELERQFPDIKHVMVHLNPAE